MPIGSNRDTLRRLALLGAKRRIEEIREEEAAIRATFPELFRAGRPRAAGSQVAGAGAARSRRRRRPMSAAERRAVSERMKRYWAERRKAKKG